MHTGESPDDFKMAQLFSADVHQQVLPIRVITIQTLNGILHRSSQLSVGPAELFEQHVAEFGIGCADMHGIHQCFDMVIHRVLLRIDYFLCFLAATVPTFSAASLELACCIRGLASSVNK